MTISSAPTTYYTTSSSVGFTAQEIGTVLPDTITLTNGTSSSLYYTGAGIGGASGSTITISNGGSSGTSSTLFTNINGGNINNVTIGGAGTGYEWAQTSLVEWVDGFPEFSRIQKMCEQYPALKIAYEKFVTTYKLVKDHYDTPEDQRPLP
jgi:hypothetical protein